MLYKEILEKIKLEDHIGLTYKTRQSFLSQLFEHYPEECSNLTNASLYNLLLCYHKQHLCQKELREAIIKSQNINLSFENYSTEILLREYDFFYHQGLNLQGEWKVDWLHFVSSKPAFKKMFNKKIMEEGYFSLLPKLALASKFMDYNYLLKLVNTNSANINQVNISYLIRHGIEINNMFNWFNISQKRRFQWANEIFADIKILLDCTRITSSLKTNQIILPKIKKPKTVIEFHDRLVDFYIKQKVLINNEELNSDYSILKDIKLEFNPVELYGAYKSLLDKNIITPKELILKLHNISGQSYREHLYHNFQTYDIETINTNDNKFNYLLFDYVETFSKKLLMDLSQDFLINYPQRGGELVKAGFNLNICVGTYTQRVVSKKSIICFLNLKRNSLILTNNKEEYLVCIEFSPIYESEIINSIAKRRRDQFKDYQLSQIKSHKNSYVHHSIEKIFKSLIK